MQPMWIFLDEEGCWILSDGSCYEKHCSEFNPNSVAEKVKCADVVVQTDSRRCPRYEACRYLMPRSESILMK